MALTSKLGLAKMPQQIIFKHLCVNFRVNSRMYGLEFAWCWHGKDVIPENQFWKPLGDKQPVFAEPPPPKEMPCFVYIPMTQTYSGWTEICRFVAKRHVVLIWVCKLKVSNFQNTCSTKSVVLECTQGIRVDLQYELADNVWMYREADLYSPPELDGAGGGDACYIMIRVVHLGTLA